MTLPISNIAPITIPAIPASITQAGVPGEFQSMLASSINTIESLNRTATESVQNFLTGKNEELHTTVIAGQQAEMAFELGLQVRNKVVDAYQEVMKMQI